MNVLMGLIIFTFVLLLDKLFELADLLLNKGVGLWLTLKLLFLLLPSLPFPDITDVDSSGCPLDVWPIVGK